MNEHAVRWIKRLTLRYALGGFVIGVVAALLMFVRLLWYKGDEPVFQITVFVGILITIVIVIITAGIGFALQIYLTPLKMRSDSEVATSVRTLPLKFAIVGLLTGMVLAGNAYYELKGDPDYEFALWAVGVAVVSFALIGLLLGLQVRSALRKRLGRPANAGVVQ